MGLESWEDHHGHNFMPAINNLMQIISKGYKHSNHTQVFFYKL